MKRKTVPIITGSKRILGLTQAEWNLNLIPFACYAIWAPGWWLKFAGLSAHILLICVYVQVSKQLEQDFIVIYMQNRKIPNIIYGIFKNPLPLQRIVMKMRLASAD